MGSFKLKLVAALITLALLPLAAAYWSFSEIVARNVTSGVDARLVAGLRASLAAYEDERRAVEATAEPLARDRDFQAALARRDRPALVDFLRRGPALRIEAPGGFRVGRVPPLAAETTVSLVGPGTRSATIVASVPLDPGLVRRLAARSGLGGPDQLAIVVSGRIGASSQGDISGRVVAPEGRVETLAIGRAGYRAVSTRLVRQPPVSLAAVTPTATIAEEQRTARTKLVAGLLASLLLIGVVAYIAGRSIVGSLGRLAAAANSIAAGRLHERVPVRGRDEFAAVGRAFNRMAAQLEERLADLEDERQRLRDANTRVGDALAATLDPDQLRRVIVQNAVEATGADGGLLRERNGSVVSVGDMDAGPRRLELELTTGRRSFGTLVLLGSEFDTEATITASSLAGQAVIALDNARMHRIVERQALVDELTGLANRRQGDEALAAELARVGRLGGSVGLILADLDDFKAVNDAYGHPTGDAVLREFAEALRRTVREIDVAVRWGGEEFGVILPGTDADGATEVAERVRAALAERSVLSVDGTSIRVTASFGVAASAPGMSADTLIDAADDALYRAKRAGKNRVHSEPWPVTPA
ncbi:MAG: diguanylate cyclase [Gaiellaceae bacterium MAG52_C11]|nr:diguanylate cyclase [Candidatus Gaiellasilicea maunaloa]